MSVAAQRRNTQKSVSSIHAEWISLLEVSGPFLSVSVLSGAEGFRQGLPKPDDDSAVRIELRGYYEQWRTNTTRRRPDPALHHAWITAVMEDVLEWKPALRDRTNLPEPLKYQHAESGETVRPDFALIDPESDRPRLLLMQFPHNQPLKGPVAISRWAESPANRMVELLRANDTRLGVITNGEEWMLVNAAAGETAGFVTWYANLWFEESMTLTAFRAILGIERVVGVAEEDQLEGVLIASAADQADVTYTLGDQVRQAIELLVAAIDREDDSRNGLLLENIEDEAVYEAAVTVMMRLVFLLFAEDQQPPLFGGNDIYDRNYSISALIYELENLDQQNGEEFLEHRYDAWQRLLATFRLVYAGSSHDLMRLPAYGGSLFDPDRFPFLEGRQPGGSWATDEAQPLPITNRTVLHVLQALQFIHVKGGRQRISFRALDVEQIGHVYEQLLEHTAKRSSSNVLGLVGTSTKGVKREPELEITELEEWEQRGRPYLLKQLKDSTGRSEKALATLLDKDPDPNFLHDLRHVCGDDDTYQRTLPFANLIRLDRAGKPIVVRAGGLYVTSGSDRATTGSHYTPRSLTEPIVQYALEPLIYEGPADGKPRDQWVLHSPKHLLELNICDPAMGSGGFLVQTCRFMADRLLEAWDVAEEKFGGRSTGEAVTIGPDGSLQHGDVTQRVLPRDKVERLAIARQMVVDHCLYGVDINHLAVDMAKLSLWLVTLQRNRPFTFLDHRLRCGDSLLGIHSLDQLLSFSLDGKRKSVADAAFAAQFRSVIQRAQATREKIEAIEVHDVTDSQRQAALLEQAEKETELLRLGADLLVAAQLHPEKNRREPQREDFRSYFSMLVDGYDRIHRGAFTPAGQLSTVEAHLRLEAASTALLNTKRPFHWALEYPEVFGLRLGFSAVVGNPPFLGGQKISGEYGVQYREFLISQLNNGESGSGDLCAYFLKRFSQLIRESSSIGIIATSTITEGATRDVGLASLVSSDHVLIRAISRTKWPGSAAVQIAVVWLFKGKWHGQSNLNGREVPAISEFLEVVGRTGGKPYVLASNRSIAFQGNIVLGDGFVLQTSEADQLIKSCPRNSEVLRPFLNGSDLNTRTDHSASRWVIQFDEMDIDQAKSYPLVWQIVEERVLPDRAQKDVRKYPRMVKEWWKHWNNRSELLRAIQGLSHVICVASTSQTLAFALVPANQIFSHATYVIALDDFGTLGLLNSSVYESWARKYASSMKGDFRFTPTDCFENFPMPDRSSLVAHGYQFNSLRSQLMQANGIGLTKLFNLRNDPADSSTAAKCARDAIRNLDASVLHSYGWDDLDLDHNFHQTQQGLRFTISEDSRKELLDRLLELNHSRHADEIQNSSHGITKIAISKTSQQSRLF